MRDDNCLLEQSGRSGKKRLFILHAQRPNSREENRFFVPVCYVLDKERRLVVTTASDCVTFAEAKANQDQLKNDPDFQPEFNHLLDATAVTVLDISSEEAERLGRASTFFSASSRRAWVAPNPFLFGIGRLIGTYREIAGGREEFRVFNDRQEALRWLGLDHQCEAV
jgi:hypothetical protein